MLRHLADAFPPADFPALLVGLDRPDDAAVYRLNDEQAIVQTLDFFPPFLDDPYIYGAIAAANAMNDIYAMGGEVLFALNIAGFPEDLPVQVAARILEGGAAKVREAGGVVAGGHTVIDIEPKYGLCVTGLVHPQRIRTVAGARPDDIIVLTKKLGTGVLINALQNDRAQAEHAEAAIEQMQQLNAAAARATHDLDVHAMTDVTGFGIGGHLIEIARSSGVEIRLAIGALPVLDGFLDYATMGLTTAGQRRNQEHFGREVHAEGPLTPEQEALLFDPQTAGGLVIVLPEGQGSRLQERLADAGVPSWRVGDIAAGQRTLRLALTPCPWHRSSTWR